ncbi:MAG: phospholipase D-like domain-containing protein [Pseudomonadota bacterium]
MTIFRLGENCWRVDNADTFTVLVDGENYFRAVRKAMQQARERIILIGWDFDTRVKMYDTQGEPEGPLEIGEYVDWLVRQNPRLHIYILQWNLGALKLFKRGRTLLKAAQWLSHSRVHVALDDAHPVGAAQHEKLIVVDESTAFCGGIDITEDRWDTREHRDNEPKRKQPGDHDAGPWHDVAARLTGDVVQSLGDHAQWRWKAATGDEPVAATNRSVDAFDDGAQQLVLRNARVAVARTRGQTDQFEAVSEIEALCKDVIADAKHHLYIESQYFTSKAVACDLADVLKRTDGPEIVLVTPATADGWLENKVMDSTRAHLIEALRAIDHHNRFHVYHPVTESGTDIYVHAKIMIADDRCLRVGSSNLANRSMGFDSECDVCIDALASDELSDAQDYIECVLYDLLSEHLGETRDRIVKVVESLGSLSGTIDRLSEKERGLRRYQVPDLDSVQEWLSKNDILDPQSENTDWPNITI